MIEFFIMFLIFWFHGNLLAIYVHRDVSHRQCTFHPIMVALMQILKWSRSFNYVSRWEKPWAANHRKHHVATITDTSNDPHSPVYKSFWFMSSKQRDPMSWQEIDRYTKDISSDKSKFDLILEKVSIGPYVMLGLFVWLFSWAGVVLWITVLSYHTWLGLFNYFTHVWPGYVNSPGLNKDRSRNIFPLMFLLYGGEELHGNHHRWPTRVNFAVRWWEVDVGYCLLKLFSWMKLVKFNYPVKSIKESLTVKFIK